MCMCKQTVNSMSSISALKWFIGEKGRDMDYLNTS